MAVDKRGKDFRNLVKYIVGKRDCLTDRLAVDILAYPPDKRRRDIDNLLKATLDALQHAGVYKDDYLIDDLRIRRKEAVKDGSLIINISEM